MASKVGRPGNGSHVDRPAIAKKGYPRHAAVHQLASGLNQKYIELCWSEAPMGSLSGVEEYFWCTVENKEWAVGGNYLVQEDYSPLITGDYRRSN